VTTAVGDESGMGRSGVLVLFGRGQDQRARENPAGKPDVGA
jgi:hypothetical protein